MTKDRSSKPEPALDPLYIALDERFGKLNWRINLRNSLLYGSPWWSFYRFDQFNAEQPSGPGIWRLSGSTRAATLGEALANFANDRELESNKMLPEQRP